MDRARGMGQAYSALAAMLWLVATAGPADAWRDEDLFFRSEDVRSVLFGSLDAGRSVFVSAGAKQALTGPLDRTGFVALEVSGLGVTRERYTPDPVAGAVRFTSETAALLGHQWVVPNWYAAVFVGPELHQEQLDVSVLRRVSRPRIGGRVVAELWAHPIDDTLLTATFISGSTRGSLYGRVSAGYRVTRELYVGPEVSGYSNTTYREAKFGLHATGLELGILRFTVAGGLQIQDDRRNFAPYLSLTSWVRL